MPGKRREREDVEPAKKAKRVKFTDNEPKSTLTNPAVEFDFPRGGGTTLTALEHKTIRAEAAREADAELFNETAKKPSKRKSRESDVKSQKGQKGVDEKKKSDSIRVEHLNYKRLTEGMKVFCNIIAIRPLCLIVSLPCQLVGHIPITHISTQLTKQLEALDEAGETFTEWDDANYRPQEAPELFEIFRIGQYVRAVVTAVRPPGTTVARDVVGLRHKMDEVERACQRVELSLIPEKVNAGVSKQDLVKGFTLPAAVQSVEDHGYILDIGVPSVTGFLPFKDPKEGPFADKLSIGHVLDVCVSAVSDNGRTCSVSIDPKLITSSSLSHITNVTSVLPGTLVQALVTAIVPSGLNVLVLGYFQGTIDLFHLPPGDIAAQYKLGQKIKARILWDMLTTEPRRFALSHLPHVVNLDVPRLNEQPVQDAFSIGTTLSVVKVHRVEPERGLVVEVQDGVFGYVHIRHVSDSHVPSLPPSSGLWKIGTVHRARVSGYHALDGILQLSLQKSVLEMKFLRAADVEVGERVKATVKKLTDAGLFVSLSGNVDGVIWPNHYADINLKHPQKRFKEGATLKCRVLVVNPDRERIVLTAKRTLVESDLPMITRPEDAQPGTVSHAVVFKVLEKAILVEFYNNLHAHISRKEASETPLVNLADAFPIGKPVKVRIINTGPEFGRISASIRQVDSKPPEVPNVLDVQVGEIVQGPIRDIHKKHAVVKLEPTGITALITLKNLAYHRGTTVKLLLTELHIGQHVEDLVVATQNPEKGIVLVKKRPKEENNAINSDNDETEPTPPSPQNVPKPIETPTLNIQGGFRWSYQPAEPEGAEAISASDPEEKALPNTTKVTKKKKKTIEYDLTLDMHDRQPESTADFERLLLGSPNSSYLWVQYMSFQLQLSEIDKAREVGKRALRTINFREESEKLNVWIALLNLENKFGTDDTLEAVFKDAARHNDSKTIHLRLASIFDETQRHQRATEQYQRTCKKFGKSSKVWSLFGEHYLKLGDLDAARQLLPRSLQSLEKRKHLKTIIKFSQLEYKLGDPEHGRTIFEGVVESHPKRWDVWSIYIDMESTQGNIQGMRNIFSRLFALKMTSHKAKAFFKKWLEIEKRIGDIDGENMVKTKAVEWTDRAGASAG